MDETCIDENSSEYKEAKNIWDDFVNEIKYRNRFNCGKKILEELNSISNVIGLNSKVGFTLYRARFGDHTNEEDSEMLEPTPEKATPGRGNPEGISYLYLSDDTETCLKELGFRNEDIATVATIKLKHPCKLHWFETYKIWNDMGHNNHLSPVQFNLICIINKEFSKVIVKNNKDIKPSIEYLPFQFITEYFRNYSKNDKKFGGIIFKSSVGKGNNFIIFDSKNVEVVDKKLYNGSTNWILKE